MKIHHLRNATFVLEHQEHFILIDPMLGPKGQIPPFSFIKNKIRRNPLVEMPQDTAVLEKVTHGLITHLHPDHLDQAGEDFLVRRKIPVTCNQRDEGKLRKKGLNVVQTLDYWQTADFCDGQITGIPAVHGYGLIAKLMGNVIGFHIEFNQQDSLYLSADTVYTADVDRVLKEYQPKVAVLAAGSAAFDVGGKLLMNEADLLTFVQNAPGQVYANHLDALNHCPMTRTKFSQLMAENQLSEKVKFPADGTTLEY